MTERRSVRRRVAGATALLVGAAALAACSSPLVADETPAPTSSAGEGAASGAAPSCDTIIAPSLVAEFESIGWTSRADPFFVGPEELPGGVSCTWADFGIDATDIVQMYGWAPVSDDDAVTYQDYLAEQGWRTEEGDGVVYVTESMPSAQWADDEGYGMTYAFGDGWVALSDTRSGLDVITWRG